MKHTVNYEGFSDLLKLSRRNKHDVDSVRLSNFIYTIYFLNKKVSGSIVETQSGIQLISDYQVCDTFKPWIWPESVKLVESYEAHDLINRDIDFVSLGLDANAVKVLDPYQFKLAQIDFCNAMKLDAFNWTPVTQLRTNQLIDLSNLKKYQFEKGSCTEYSGEYLPVELNFDLHCNDNYYIAKPDHLSQTFIVNFFQNLTK